MVGAIGDSMGRGEGVAGLGLPMAGVDAAMSARQDDFASVIARAKNAAGAGAGERRKATREAAEQFVAAALVQPILAQLRSTNQAAAPFAATSGERSFQQMADAQTALSLVRKSNFPIVDQIADAIERKGRRTGGVADGVKA